MARLCIDPVHHIRAPEQNRFEYVKNRKAFGSTIGSFQNTKFELAACATEVHTGQVLIDWAIESHDRGELDATSAAMVKLSATEMQGRVVDRCLHLYGGYGYCIEYPIARHYADARVTRIYGGSSEIMKGDCGEVVGTVNNSGGRSPDATRQRSTSA
jgi:acyl-CoA dehydrogenase